LIADAELTTRVKERAEFYRPRIIKFLRDLIRIPSRSGEEGDAMRRIEQEMKALGLADVHIDAIGNVVGRVGNGEYAVLYDSHIDTVGVGDEAAWPHDPYEGKFEDGVIYGRGASDNKAAIACMVYAGKIMLDLGLGSGASLFITGVAQEEDCDGWAVGEAIARGFFGRRPDCVVLGECTNLGINRGHRGRCEISVTTRGVSCHGSAPARGVNAVYAMTPIVEGIVALEREVAHDPFLGAGTIAVTKIESVSGSLNVVPDLCRIVIDRRMTTGETAAGAMDDIRRVAAGASGPGGTAAVTAAARAASVELLRYTERSWTGYQADVEKDYPTWLLDEDHPVVQAGVAAARLVLGREPAISRWDFSTDGVATMGRHKIPTIGFGPSEERFAHTVQDQVSVDHLMAATAFYALFPDTVARMHG
jgi:putative selenium metabolism hydrolase